MSRRDGGQTLLEVFIAMLLIITVLFAVLSMYPSSVASVRKSESTVTAQNLARDYLETFRTVPFQDTPCDPSPPPFTLAGMATNADPNPWVTTFPPSPAQAPAGWDGRIYTVVVTATFPLIGGVPATDVVELDLDVLWTAGAQDGNQIGGTPAGTYANSSLHETTCVYNVQNTW